MIIFQRGDLPINTIHTCGAVLRLSVWNQGILINDFIGECFVQLNSLQSLRNVASLRDIPVSTLHLKKPEKNSQPDIFAVNKTFETFFFFNSVSCSSCYDHGLTWMRRRLFL